VLGHIEGGEIITTFFNRAGDPARQIGVFPGNTLTLTNLLNDKSVTVVSTGSYHAQVNPDGSGSFASSGPGPLVSNPITGEPGIWYLRGRLDAAFDADGNRDLRKPRRLPGQSLPVAGLVADDQGDTSRVPSPRREGGARGRGPAVDELHRPVKRVRAAAPETLEL
jgi:hypothetical protein